MATHRCIFHFLGFSGMGGSHTTRSARRCPHSIKTPSRTHEFSRGRDQSIDRCDPMRSGGGKPHACKSSPSLSVLGRNQRPGNHTTGWTWLRKQRLPRSIIESQVRSGERPPSIAGVPLAVRAHIQRSPIVRRPTSRIDMHVAVVLFADVNAHNKRLRRIEPA